VKQPKIYFEIECMPEDVPLRGNCSAIDPETDAETERMIIEQLEAGNEWAWCTVKVTARIEGIDLEGTDYLGCCSYKSESDFMACGYFADMKSVAKRDLLEKIRESINLNETIGA
jgi:hypothetical protein